MVSIHCDGIQLCFNLLQAPKSARAATWRRGLSKEQKRHLERAPSIEQCRAEGFGSPAVPVHKVHHEAKLSVREPVHHLHANGEANRLRMYLCLQSDRFKKSRLAALRVRAVHPSCSVAAIPPTIHCMLPDASVF
jgi:hypothetical protein